MLASQNRNGRRRPRPGGALVDTCQPPQPPDSVVVQVDRLLRLVFGIFEAVGCAPDEARAVSERTCQLQLRWTPQPRRSPCHAIS